MFTLARTPLYSLGPPKETIPVVPDREDGILETIGLHLSLV